MNRISALGRRDASQGDFHAAAYCIKEGLEQNQDKEDNWGLHYMAGDIFSQLRRMSPDPKEQKQYLILAYKSYLTSHQCTDCDHKAHVLCKAAAVASILRDPDLAFALYNRAMEEEPDNLEVPHDLGGFLWDMGELDKAAEQSVQVQVELHPSVDGVLSRLENVVTTDAILLQLV